MLRAIAYALPFVVATCVLLADADAVFAGLVTPDVDGRAGLGHAALIAIAASLVVALRGIAHRIDARDPARDGRFGTLEAVTMLGLVAGVLTVFVVAQLVALTDAGTRLVRDAGLTPAQYARSGFFQLCWAAAVVTVLLAVIRRMCEPGTFDGRALRCLHAAVPVLTIGLVVVGLRRMELYDEAFGLTMLRLWAVGVIVGIGVILLALAIRNAAFPRANPIGGIALTTAFVLVAVANVANPEAYVVAHNAARSRAGASVDVEYLGTLSDDAVPQIADTFGRRPALVRALVHCAREADGVSRLNRAVRRAAAIRREACRHHPSSP
jgi:hypothetical protein